MKESINKSKLHLMGWGFLIVLLFVVLFNIFRQGIYSSKLGLTVAVVGNNSVGLMSIRPDEEIISWVDLPGNLKVEIAGTKATYPLTSLWDFCTHNRRKYETFEKSLGMTLGIAISRVMKVKGEAKVESVLGNLHRINLDTDISIRDRFLMRQFISDAVDAKKIIDESPPKKIFNEIKEPDGKVFLEVNSVSSQWTNSKFVLEPVLGENVDVSVFNLSGVSGYGYEVANQLESAGMRVVGVKGAGNNPPAGSGCIFTINGNFPISEKFLIQQMWCRRIKDMIPKEKGIEVWLR